MPLLNTPQISKSEKKNLTKESYQGYLVSENILEFIHTFAHSLKACRYLFSLDIVLSEIVVSSIWTSKKIVFFK